VSHCAVIKKPAVLRLVGISCQTKKPRGRLGSTD